MSSPPHSTSTSLARLPSLVKVPSLGRVPSRVPSFDDLPVLPHKDRDTDSDIELDHIGIDSDPSSLNNTTEIQIAYEEQRQTYEAEHGHDLASHKGEDHLISVRELAVKYDVHLDSSDPAQSQGLNSVEANNRIEKYGRNVITPAATVPEWKKFLGEFIGVFSVMLELAGLGCLINYGLSGAPENLFLGIILWLVVIISGSLNYHQTRKSGRVMSGFGSLVPTRTVVVRDGQFGSTPAEDLVPGDVLRMKGGDKVPADIRLIQCNGLKVDNSSLTGESEPLPRTVDTTEPSPFEATNLVFMGTLCLEGEAIGVVLQTGDTTVLGKTAQLAMSTKTELTVLQKEIKQFVKRISIIGVTVGIIVLVVSLALKVAWMDALVFGIGSIVAIVPEGLQLTVTLALTLTATRMSRNNVLVKKLAIVETLGCTSVICSDKTGTLTQNNMTVSYIVYNNSIHQCNNLVHTLSRIEMDDVHYQALSKAATLCNRAFFDPSDETGKLVIGDASESALLRYVSQIYDVPKIRNDNPKVLEIPFNSENKWQLSIHRNVNEPKAPYHLLLKGAPERVISRCSHVFMNGEIVPLTEETKKELEAIIDELASIGQRVLGFAQDLLDPTQYTPGDYEFDTTKMNFPTTKLTFIGFVAIYDPPREKVDEAISICQGAGIRVVMVTGDHPSTAKAIAKQIGIIKGETPEEILAMEGNTYTPDEARRLAPAIVVPGTDLEGFTEDDWDIVISKSEIVFARTSPEQKLLIVSHFQAKGEIVAVTGDGVNDSPALKRADVGIAMGITGSAVAKEAADIILMDDNFATIVQAVEEGRLIFDNLKKSIAYALSVKMAEVLPFLAFVIFGLPLPLSTILVLCIDIGTDLIPGISLAYEKAELTLMTRRPRIPNKHKLVNMKLVVFSFVHMGIIQMVSGFTSYFLSMHNSGFSIDDLFFKRDYFRRGSGPLTINGIEYSEQYQRDALGQAQTAFFCSIILTQLADILVCKTRYLSFFQQKSRNHLMLIGMMIAVCVAVIFTYVPGTYTVLGTKPIDGIDWVYMIPFSVFMFAQDELRKWLIRRNPQGPVARYTYW